MLADWFVYHKRFGRFKQLFDVEPLEPRPLASFPRVLHFYWDQGIEHAPDLVRLCLDSWRARNPGWTIRLWDADSAGKVVDRGSLPEGLKTTPYSDILRTCILDDEGGVWVDATVYCMQPLDGWLPFVMTQCDFFAFRRPGRDREISSWFLASRKDGRIIGELRLAAIAYWSRQKRPTRVYHWYHYLFEYLVRTSPRFRREWEQTPKLSAVPLILLQDRLAAACQPEASELEMLRAAPMHKLTYKKPQDLERLRELVGDREAHEPESRARNAGRTDR